ncbi:hypothetical protein BGZ93_001783 [Podila epicladia]|nr:hypothetical protein BGZ93_001783 [Podila epicladia]KAG0087372.1 hypothetical protein BGZ92_007395 [Podila epicladia]
MYQNETPRPVFSGNMGSHAHQVSQQRQRKYSPHQPYHSTHIIQTVTHGISPVGASPYVNYSPVPGPLPTFSAQALQTFAPMQLGITKDAPMVPIQSLRPEKAFVAMPDKKESNKTRWLQSFTIKDDDDTIEVTFWHNTREHLERNSGITLDQVVHVWTDDVKPKNKSSFGGNAAAPLATSSPLTLTLSEGRAGHKVVPGSEQEQATMFKTALGANSGGVVCAMQVKNILNPTSNVNTKNGPKARRVITVFDLHGQDASLTLWGDEMCDAADSWISMETRPQISMYAMKPQITVSFQTHLQVNPICKNVEWLRHFANQCASLPDQLNPVADPSEVQLTQIQSCYYIIDISHSLGTLGFLETVYGFCYAVICQLDIDNHSEMLLSKCPSCKEPISSFKIEACPSCRIVPSNEDQWQYNMTRYISFMDHTAELTHPNVPSSIITDLFGFQISNSSTEASQPRVQVLSIERAHLPEVVA